MIVKAYSEPCDRHLYSSRVGDSNYPFVVVLKRVVRPQIFVQRQEIAACTATDSSVTGILRASHLVFAERRGRTKRRQILPVHRNVAVTDPFD